MWENKGIVLTIIIVFVLCIGALVGVIYSMLEALEILEFGQVHALSPDREVRVVERNIDFNFAIPQDTNTQDELEESKEEPNDDNQDDNEKDENTDEEKSPEETKKPQYNYNFKVPKIETYPSMTSIQIPSIAYDSPIIVSDNADSGVDQGAWYMPGNHPMEAEAIFLCHRRYFNSFDPRSCWNLDKVQKGNFLYLNFADGSQMTYEVQSISVTSDQDLNIFHTSKDKIVKLVSCSMEDGKIGADTHRIVLLAKAV